MPSRWQLYCNPRNARRARSGIAPGVWTALALRLRVYFWIHYSLHRRVYIHLLGCSPAMELLRSRCLRPHLALLACIARMQQPWRGSPPEGKAPFTTSRWIYNDQASTWRSTADSYSQEMNVVLHDVDHICPFTGTAIAQRNMRRFIAFQLSLIFLGLALCAFVAAGVAVSALPQGTER